MVLPHLPGNKRRNNSVSEMLTPPKKHFVISENDDNNCERSDNQHNDVTQSPRGDVTQLPINENQQNDISESPSEIQQNDVTISPISEDEEPDFSKLPSVVWTMIMSNLEEGDRLALAMTCQSLYNYCKTKSILWRSATMRLGNWKRKWIAHQVELTPTEMSVVRSHSHQIKNMEFVIHSLRGLEFSERTFHILNDAVTNWPLKKMRIYCRVNARPEEPVVNNVSQLIMNCLTSEQTKGLECLVVSKCFWTYGDEGSVILEALKVSSFTDSLKYLTLGQVRSPKTFDPSHITPQVVECVGRFQNLQVLGLFTWYLSDLLLEMLSNSMTSQLKYLDFIGNFKSFQFQEGITKWPQLLSACPDLRVRLLVQHNVNCEGTLAAFPPIVPVQYVKIKNFTDTSEQDSRRELLKLLPAYSKTLTIFLWRDQSRSDFDSILIDTVKQCPKLDSLMFNGRISSSSISTLASMRDWQSLEFLERSIAFPESNTETQAEQMSKLKTAVRLQRKSVKFARGARGLDSKKIYLARPIQFKFRCWPVQL